MSLPRLVGGFALRFALLYGGLMALWPILGQGYTAMYRSAGEEALRMCSTVHSASLTADETGGNDTVIFAKENRLTPRHTQANFQAHVNPCTVAYMPTVQLIALVLATPVPWRRRALALLAGLVLMNLYLAATLDLVVVGHLKFQGDKLLGVDSLSTKVLYPMARFVYSFGPGNTVVAPIIIWMLVTFRRTDWAPWREAAAAERHAGRRPRR